MLRILMQASEKLQSAGICIAEIANPHVNHVAIQYSKHALNQLVC